MCAHAAALDKSLRLSEGCMTGWPWSARACPLAAGKAALGPFIVSLRLGRSVTHAAVARGSTAAVLRGAGRRRGVPAAGDEALELARTRSRTSCPARARGLRRALVSAVWRRPQWTWRNPAVTGRLLRRDEAAEVLGVSTRTLKRRIAAGELPVFVDGRVRRVRAVDLERYVAERVRVPPRSVPQLGNRGRAVAAGGRLWD